MDLSAVKAIVDENFKFIRNGFQLHQWHVDFSYERLEGNDSASCRTLPEYRKVFIILDHDKMEDIADVLDTLRHEAIHILLAEYNKVLFTVGGVMSENARAVYSDAYDLACEFAVGNIERLLDHGVNVPVKKMINIQKRLLK